MVDDRVSLYRCYSCGKFRICEKGNHHPWCLTCMDDEFDYAAGIEDITRQEAERILDEDS